MSGSLTTEAAGPLERHYLQYANYRAVADSPKLTRTHWHIAVANGLGRGAFSLAFLTIPVFMTAMAVGVWFLVPEHAGKELNAIAV